ncbi:MAG: cyclic nucleotide-binding domain-containing protein [Myxococcaceae bacterium]|nr:cyclic nucleotide-binding domain-containing protein [Myxococcaceae bacterium]
MADEYDFIDDEAGGRFVPIGGPLVQLRNLVHAGDTDTAVKLYEETGGLARDSILDEAREASFETKKAWANVLKRARDFAAAGSVYEMAKLESEAAWCHEQAHDYAAAGGAYARSGDLLKAAASYERAGKGAEAVDLYKSAGAREALAECLARQFRYEEAAEVFRALNNTHAEVEVLRASLRERPGNVQSACRLVEIMVLYGHARQAADLLMETARRSPAARSDAKLLDYLARLLEGIGSHGAAEKVRARLKVLGKPQAQGAMAAGADAKPPPPDGYGFLKALPMFEGLSLPEMKALYRICSGVSFTPGQNVIEPGQPGRGLYVVIDGQVEVFGGADPSSRLLNTLGPGSYVGEISLVRDSPTTARVTARTAVKALFVARDSFEKYLYGNPGAALAIYRLFTLNLAERVRVLSAAR